MKPLISIVVLSSNSLNLIKEAIESVIAKTYTNWGLLSGDGFDVVDTIGQVETGNSAGHADVPNKPIIIEKVIIS